MNSRTLSEKKDVFNESESTDSAMLDRIANRLAGELHLDSLDVRRVIEGHLADFSETDSRADALRAFSALLWNE